MKPALSVVLPTHNRCQLLRRVLAAYDAQSGAEPFELIVADDASSDGTDALLRSFVPTRYRLVPTRLDRGAGPGQARNAAISRSSAPLLLLVGDDIVPAGDLVTRHLEAHRRRPQALWAVLGLTTWPDELPVNSLMRHVDGVGGQQFGYAHIRDGQELDFRHFYTSNVSVKRELLDKVRPWFDPDFVHAAYEDAELAYRLTRQAGLRIRFEASARATHHHPYDVVGFAERQYRCGLMASLLLRKHPELRSRFRAERLRRLDWAAQRPLLRAFLDGLGADEEANAEKLALALGSACETLSGTTVDRVYLVLLEYFALKGMLDGEHGDPAAERPRRALLLFCLLPRLADALGQARGRGLAETEAGAQLLALVGHYQAMRRAWPRLASWLPLAAVRSTIVPRF